MRLLKMERLQKHTVHNGKKSGVGADAESKSRDCQHRESGAIQKCPDAVANILPKSFHPPASANFSVGYLASDVPNCRGAVKRQLNAPQSFTVQLLAHLTFFLTAFGIRHAQLEHSRGRKSN